MTESQGDIFVCWWDEEVVKHIKISIYFKILVLGILSNKLSKDSLHTDNKAAHRIIHSTEDTRKFITAPMCEQN
jgi:hypothetical protein